MKSFIRDGCILLPLETIDLSLVMILRGIQSVYFFSVNMCSVCALTACALVRCVSI